jgi:hypothetical protein
MAPSEPGIHASVDWIRQRGGAFNRRLPPFLFHPATPYVLHRHATGARGRHCDYKDSASVGMLDVVLALQSVKQNIGRSAVIPATSLSSAGADRRCAWNSRGCPRAHWEIPRRAAIAARPVREAASVFNNVALACSANRNGNPEHEADRHLAGVRVGDAADHAARQGVSGGERPAQLMLSFWFAAIRWPRNRAAIVRPPAPRK